MRLQPASSCARDPVSEIQIECECVRVCVCVRASVGVPACLPAVCLTERGWLAGGLRGGSAAMGAILPKYSWRVLLLAGWQSAAGAAPCMQCPQWQGQQRQHHCGCGLGGCAATELLLLLRAAALCIVHVQDPRPHPPPAPLPLLVTRLLLTHVPFFHHSGYATCRQRQNEEEKSGETEGARGSKDHEQCRLGQPLAVREGRHQVVSAARSVYLCHKRVHQAEI